MKIAITGGIAEGKSTVLEVLRSEGLRVLSADEIVRQLWSERSTLDSLSQLLSLENPTKGDVTRAIVESNTARQVVKPDRLAKFSQELKNFFPRGYVRVKVGW